LTRNMKLRKNRHLHQRAKSINDKIAHALRLAKKYKHMSKKI